jgi:N-acetylneuraminate synthase
MPQINIGRRHIGDGTPTYFVADISANHDGDLGRAKALIHLAARAGADAAKFQNFRAPKIVSEQGFNALGGQLSHQSSWKKSVIQVYKEATLPSEWTEALKAECDAAGIDYFSAPYDFEAVDLLNPHVSLFKIGSGDITWIEILEKIARTGKPVLLATGASSIGDVQRAVHAILPINDQLVLMQCNTNYTGSLENFRHIHLNVLTTYRNMFPGVVLGLSDHTPGHTTVLGAVALGARVIEKHFTDDNTRPGPDHPFSMTPAGWREMVDRTREMELALGSGDKFVVANETDTVVVQRRCLRAARPLEAGTILLREHIDVLRPAPRDAIFPYEIDGVIGKRLRGPMISGDHFRWTQLDDK